MNKWVFFAKQRLNNNGWTPPVKSLRDCLWYDKQDQKGSVNLPQGSVKLVVLCKDCKDCTKDYPEKNWDVQVIMEGCEIPVNF